MQPSVIKKINLKKLQQQIADIETISKKNGWSFVYNEDLDHLYFSPREIPKGFSLLDVDDFYVFVDEESNLGGIFIEYYKANLSSHEKEFKPFKNLFDKGTKKTKDWTQDKIQFSEVLKAELLSHLVKNDQSVSLAF